MQSQLSYCVQRLYQAFTSEGLQQEKYSFFLFLWRQTIKISSVDANSAEEPIVDMSKYLLGRMTKCNGKREYYA